MNTDDLIFLIATLAVAFVILGLCLLAHTSPKEPVKDLQAEVLTVDDCEYLLFPYSSNIVHKGNCTNTVHKL